MALLTVQEQVSTLLQRNLVEDKTKGTPSVQVEAAAVMDSVALNLVFNPRTVLYFAHLARNGLLTLVGEELAAAAALKQTIQDLGNQSFALRDLKALERAKTSLLQIETQGQVLSTEGAFKGFDDAASEFLDKQLSKNVRRQGVSTLVRPNVEAAAALPSDYSSFQELHAQVDERLGYLVEGVRSFSTSNLSGTIGLNTAFRVRRDVEDIIVGLQNDPAASGSREYATRLVAARSVLRFLGSPPGVFDAKVSTKDGLPYGYSLRGISSSKPFEMTSTTGPWPVSYHVPIILTKFAADGTPTTVSKLFPMTSSAFMIGTTYGGWTVPAQGGLFFRGAEGWSVRVVLNATDVDASVSVSDVVAAVNAQAPGYLHATEIWESGNGRVGFWSVSGLEFSLADTFLEVHIGATSGASTLWTNSARALLGLPFESDSQNGQYSAIEMKDCLGSLFVGSGASFDVSGDSLILKAPLLPGELLQPTIGESAWPIFIAPAAPATSPEVLLSGTYLGGVWPPVTDPPTVPDLTSLVSSGDRLTSSTGTSMVASVGSSLVLDTALPIFDGPVTVDSGLVLMWQQLQADLDVFFSTWPQHRSLGRLDALIAPLYGSPTLARRNDALAALQVLVDALESLQTVLLGSPLTASVDAERSVAQGIMATLDERKFDRAKAFLLQGRFSEVFALDWQTASLSGELMAAASSVASNDLTWPNVSVDEQHPPYATNDTLEVP